MPPMFKARILTAFLILTFVPVVAGQRASSGDVVATDRLARIDKVLQQYVDENKIPGAVALVLRDGRPIYDKAFGWSDKESGRKMTHRHDLPHRLADQGADQRRHPDPDGGRRADADHAGQPVHPGFAKTTVAVKSGEQVATVPAKRAITIRDLLTHTAGISYGTDATCRRRIEAKGLGPAAGFGWYTADKDEPVCDTMERLGTLPFVAQPGEAYVYGYNTDILGCVVERASGMPLDQFIATRITGPLGMKDTHFFLPADAARAPGDGVCERPRRQDRARAGRRARPGALRRRPAQELRRRRRPALDGARLRALPRDDPQRRRARRRPHPRAAHRRADDDQPGRHAASDAGLGFGLGFETTDRYGANGLSSVGAFGWGGAYGSTYRVDPDARLMIVFMIQLMPNRTDVAQKFPNLVYQALMDAPRTGSQHEAINRRLQLAPTFRPPRKGMACGRSDRLRQLMNRAATSGPVGTRRDARLHALLAAPLQNRGRGAGRGAARARGARGSPRADEGRHAARRLRRDPARAGRLRRQSHLQPAAVAATGRTPGRSRR